MESYYVTVVGFPGPFSSGTAHDVDVVSVYLGMNQPVERVCGS